ncbi:hypothetical protein PsYK624_003810 [Phanerochaete sordida]|uniref:Uncharacterized protein n=1 Tax=Phanerochaete sordida TaxID=48140 RepID=A0A9P3FXS5_9APHY|nr:hypothetical protein PsYK624_003810 [Phanerochaete sordida]
MAFNWKLVRPLVVAMGGSSDDGVTFGIAKENPHLDFIVQDTVPVDTSIVLPDNVHVAEVSDLLGCQTERPQVYFLANQRIIHTFTETQLSLMLVRLHRAAIQSNARLVIIYKRTGITGKVPLIDTNRLTQSEVRTSAVRICSKSRNAPKRRASPA